MSEEDARRKLFFLSFFLSFRVQRPQVFGRTMLDSTRSTSLVTFCRCSSVRRASRHRRLLETSIAIKLHQLGSNPVTAPAKRHDNDSQGPIFRGDSIETDNQAYLSRGSIETGSEVLKFPFGDDKRQLASIKYLSTSLYAYRTGRKSRGWIASGHLECLECSLMDF